jgi:hypothetical protein
MSRLGADDADRAGRATSSRRYAAVARCAAHDRRLVSNLRQPAVRVLTDRTGWIGAVPLLPNAVAVADEQAHARR